jgi:hypothetical protein
MQKILIIGYLGRDRLFADSRSFEAPISAQDLSPRIERLSRF